MGVVRLDADADAAATVQSLVERVPIAILALDEPIAVAAAALQAAHPKLRLPDALVVATREIRGSSTYRAWSD